MEDDKAHLCCVHGHGMVGPVSDDDSAVDDNEGSKGSQDGDIRQSAGEDPNNVAETRLHTQTHTVSNSRLFLEWFLRGH